MGSAGVVPSVGPMANSQHVFLRTRARRKLRATSATCVSPPIMWRISQTMIPTSLTTARRVDLTCRRDGWWSHKHSALLRELVQPNEMVFLQRAGTTSSQIAI